MEQNNKFFTAAEIYVRLLSSFPKKASEISKVNVMRWCSEVVTEYLTDPVGMVPHYKVPLGVLDGGVRKIVNNRVELPIDVFKLEAVYDQNNSLVRDCTNQGQYVQFSTARTPEKVFIDYYSIPIGEDGFPLIKRGYEAACYAYCVYKMFEEDAGTIPPRIPQWRWFQIVQDKEHELGAAANSWSDLTDNDLRDIHNYLISPDYLRQITGVRRVEFLDGGSIHNQK
jgi:hypothetical protein